MNPGVKTLYGNSKLFVIHFSECQKNEIILSIHFVCLLIYIV